jgi:probable F420-dependent oxidoreductase
MELKKLGVWAGVEHLSAAAAAGFVKRVEAMGYGALWIPESSGREAFSSASWLLANTEKLVIGTGIATIYARDPASALSAQNTLCEQSGGRFLLGLGVSHVPLVEGMRGAVYGKPIETMRNYLERMRKGQYTSIPPAEKPKTVIAALGPKMLELAGELADGVHPYNVTPEHTAQARKILGPGKLICVEQAVLLETDAAKARAVGRKFLGPYFRLPNYVNNWRRLGFGDADFEGGGSDRFVDAIIAWGDEKAIRARIEAHWAAGADHVCIQTAIVMARGDEPTLQRLAPG